MNAIATSPAPGGMMRLGVFVSLALPGACLAGTCGPLMVNAIMGGANLWLACLFLFLLLFSARLLLYGTQTIDQPLFLLVFLPMPLLVSLGFHLGYLGMDAGFPVAVGGMATPAIMYVRVSRYYRRRARAASRSEYSVFSVQYSVRGDAVPPGPSNSEYRTGGSSDSV